MTTWADLPLSPDHAAVLDAAAVLPEVARSIGVRTADTVTDLPEDLAYLGQAVLPALLFPWREPSGQLRTQIKPVTPVTNGKGQQAKYLFGLGNHAQLVVGKADPDATRVLIVEGSKQVLAAASYAPAGTSVYGVLGCRGWSKDGVPTPDLVVVEDREVFICLDGDVSSNLDVYSAAVALADACKMQGATGVQFVRLGAGKKAGLDDVLGAQVPNRRAGMLLRMIGNATKKPADTKPKAKAKVRTVSAGGSEGLGGDRPTIPVNGDRHYVINDLTRALGERWDGTRLFNFGGALSTVEGHQVEPLEKGAFLDLLAGTAVMVTRSEDGEGNVKETAAWPDPNVVMAVASRGKAFTKLDQIQRAPFVRIDGTVVTTPGYDQESATLLALAEGLEVNVADDPSPEGVAAAVAYLQEEWLGDFPFPTQADRANALALVLTPMIRGLCTLVPVAVVNGLQMGVGKNKFANCVSLVAIGEQATPLGYNRDGEEQRKVMTAVFRSGQTLMVWDECHHLEGEHFARAITSPTYSDRVLGGSIMVNFPNRATWVTLGNSVRVEGDMMRRVYQIAMRTDSPNPQDRASSSFRHPDIEGWTLANRATILAALLTLVRAWYAAGRPGPEGGTSFGSFEQWERVVGGILRVAGVPGFLGNQKEFRSDSDYSQALWELHLAGLWEHFGDREFTAKEVTTWLARNADTAEQPPGMADLSAPGYVRTLGMAYQRQRDRWHGSYRLVRGEGTGHGKVAKWAIVVHPGKSPNIPLQREGVEGPEEVPPFHVREKNIVGDVLSDETITAPVKSTRNSRVSELEPSSAPSTPSVIVEDPFHVPEQRAATAVDQRPANPFTEHTDPLEGLYALAEEPVGMECGECATVRLPVPPSGIGYACPACHPQMFVVSPPF